MMSQDKIIQIAACAADEGVMYECYGLGESGILYGLVFVLQRDEDRKPLKDSEGQYIYRKYWELVNISPSISVKQGGSGSGGVGTARIGTPLNGHGNNNAPTTGMAGPFAK